jgi:hypothetical protein
MINSRKHIKDYITANGASTAPVLVQDSVLKGALPDRVEAIIKRMTTNGKLIKSGNDYSLPV